MGRQAGRTAIQRNGDGEQAAALKPSFESYGGTGPENYERYFVPSIGAPLAADLVETAAPRPGERVLDVACGTRWSSG